MSNMQLYEPFSPEIFTDFFKEFARPMRFDFAALAPSIKLEVSEKDDAFHIKAEVPGVRKEDIKVKIDGDRVSISAETRQEKDEKQNGKVIKSEFHYGTTSRVVSLGEDVDAEKATAAYENGVLNLNLPKRPSTAAKSLTVQ